MRTLNNQLRWLAGRARWLTVRRLLPSGYFITKFDRLCEFCKNEA